MTRPLRETARVIRNEPAFVLLDEQQVVFSEVLTTIHKHQAVPDSCPRLPEVRGGVVSASPSGLQTTSRPAATASSTFRGI